MWIRSQDKSLLIKVDKFEIIKKEMCKHIFFPSDYIYHIMSNNICLGTYSTKEKALKVLNMMELKIDDIEYKDIHGSFVFQMPQEEDL